MWLGHLVWVSTVAPNARWKTVKLHCVRLIDARQPSRFDGQSSFLALVSDGCSLYQKLCFLIYI